MKSILVALTAIAASCVASEAPSSAHLLPALRPYVEEVVRELDRIPAERKEVLGRIAAIVAMQLAQEKRADLTFICTHNSRRSHMSQIWLEAAACYFGFAQVRGWSGGTEVTACNCRTVTTMRRAGFDIQDATEGDNPVYVIQYADNRPPIRAYSKLYNAEPNPRRGFIALMTCSKADQTCPAVEGAVARFAIHYTDPRLCDDTPTETTAYNERCREIAREMFYIMAEARRQLDTVARQ